MGFSSYAVVSNRRNRAFQRSGKQSVFSKKYCPPKLYKKSHHEITLDSSSIRTKELRNFLIKTIPALLIVLLMTTLFCRHLVLGDIKNQTQNSERVASIYPDKFTEIKSKLYHKHVKRGTRLLKQKDYNNAFYDFKVAIKMYPTKKAELGLTIALMHLCHKDKSYCESAREHFNFLMKSDKVSENNKSKLIEIASVLSESNLINH